MNYDYKLDPDIDSNAEAIRDLVDGMEEAEVLHRCKRHNVNTEEHPLDTLRDILFDILVNSDFYMNWDKDPDTD